MPRRLQIRLACRRCRKKRAKCDGLTPCKRCVEADEECDYDNTRRESKDDLRAEIDRLRKCTEENERLIRAIYAIKDGDVSNAVLQHLVEGTKSRRAILYELAHLNADNGRLSRAGAPAPESIAVSSKASFEDPVCARCLDSILSPSMHRFLSDSSVFSDSADTPKPASAPALATPISLSSFSFDDCSDSQSDRWTRAGWTVASVRQVFEALMTWDNFPFCLICKNPFFRDYYSGSTRYCSSALVNALLALAIRVVNENIPETQSPGPGWSRSKAFFDEAEAILHNTGPPDNLPDIQALGILSLYQVTCGRESEAQELAESFAAQIGELCLQEPLLGAEAEEYSKVRVTSYCGAVSLIRMIRMTTGQVFNLSTDLSLQDDSVFLDQPPFRPDYDYASHCGGGMPSTPGVSTRPSPLHDLQLIPARVFQLTEWLYKLLSATHRPNGCFDLNAVMAVYTKCLDWYEKVFPLLTGERDTPFVLFIHMFYQFCLLCLFRPLANLALVNSDVRPRDICLQAAQSILALSQSYNRLFTMQRVSAFVPYFVRASGLVGLTMDQACGDATLPLAQTFRPESRL